MQGHAQDGWVHLLDSGGKAAGKLYVCIHQAANDASSDDEPDTKPLATK